MFGRQKHEDKAEKTTEGRETHRRGRRHVIRANEMDTTSIRQDVGPPQIVAVLGSAKACIVSE